MSSRKRPRSTAQGKPKAVPARAGKRKDQGNQDPADSDSSRYGLNEEEKKRFLSIADSYDSVKQGVEELRKAQKEMLQSVKTISATVSSVRQKTEEIEKVMQSDEDGDEDTEDDRDPAGETKDTQDPQAAAALKAQQDSIAAALKDAKKKYVNPGAVQTLAPHQTLPGSGGFTPGELPPTIAATAQAYAPSTWAPPLPTSAYTACAAAPKVPSPYHYQAQPAAASAAGASAQSTAATAQYASLSVRSVALDPTQWIAYVGTQGSGGISRLDLLLHELSARFFIDKLYGSAKAASENALDAIRTYLQITSATPQPTAFSSECLVAAARSLWYGKLVHTHGTKTADAWLLRASDAPLTFADFQAAMDALPASLKNPKEDRESDRKGSRFRRRGGKRWKGGRREKGSRDGGDGKHSQKRGSESKDSGQGNGKKE